MLKIEKTVLPSPEQWEIVIEGLRNPMNSWDKMDSKFVRYASDERFEEPVTIGEADHKLMMSLNKGGTEHSKYRRMIPVWVTINAPLYWWKEADAYTVGKVQNSCSTMHKIHAKEFTLDDFSHEHLTYFEQDGELCRDWLGDLEDLIDDLNLARGLYLLHKDKKYWWQMIQLLPTSYNQKRTVMLNYEVLAKMYRERKNHKLDEWHTFCDWIKTLPYSELITMEE
jgi:hypothetical protein